MTSWTVAHQPPLSMEFSRQEHWSGLPRPLPGDLPDPGIGPRSPVSPALASGFFTVEPPGKPLSQLRWLQTHEIDIGAIHRNYSDITSSIFTCMCVHVCLALCKTCVCVCSLAEPPPQCRYCNISTRPSHVTFSTHTHLSLLSPWQPLIPSLSL